MPQISKKKNAKRQATGDETESTELKGDYNMRSSSLRYLAVGSDVRLVYQRPEDAAVVRSIRPIARMLLLWEVLAVARVAEAAGPAATPAVFSQWWVFSP